MLGNVIITVCVAGFTREELGGFVKQSNVVVQVGDLLLKILHALLLVGP